MACYECQNSKTERAWGLDDFVEQSSELPVCGVLQDKETKFNLEATVALRFLLLTDEPNSDMSHIPLLLRVTTNDYGV